MPWPEEHKIAVAILFRACRVTDSELAVRNQFPRGRHRPSPASDMGPSLKCHSMRIHSGWQFGKLGATPGGQQGQQGQHRDAERQAEPGPLEQRQASEEEKRKEGLAEMVPPNWCPQLVTPIQWVTHRLVDMDIDGFSYVQYHCQASCKQARGFC